MSLRASESFGKEKAREGYKQFSKRGPLARSVLQCFQMPLMQNLLKDFFVLLLPQDSNKFSDL